MTRCVIWCACAAMIFPAITFAQSSPEEAFVESSASQSVPVAKAAPVISTDAGNAFTPAGGETGESAFDWWLAQTEKPTPFYQHWLDSLFSLVAPGEPYRRDKLVLTLGTSLGYDDNVLYSAINRISSPVFGVNAAADYHFGSRRLQLDANLAGGVNYYENRPGGSNDDNFALTLAVQYRLLPRLGLSLTTRTAYLSQPSPQLIGGTFQYTGSYLYTDTKFGISYQMRPRFSLTLDYDYNGVRYDDEVINQGSGFYQQTFSFGGNWLLTPRTTLILQYRYNPVEYYESGISSTGQFLLVGLKQSLSPRLNYTFLFGAEHRALENPDPGSPSSYLGPFAEGSLEYNFAPRSKLTGTMRLGTEPSGTSGVTIRRTFRAALNATHSLGSRLTLDLGVGFEKDYYDQPGIVDYSQDVYSATAALRYQIALYTSVVLRDDYLAIEGSTENSSYTRNFVSIGLEVTF